MKNRSRRGFTITELIIVIVVIAVLAAVLIPQFSGVIGKAQMSNDIQFIRNIHTILETERTKNNGVLSGLEQAKSALAANGIKRLKLDHPQNALYWNPDDCYIILYNYDEDQALAPEKYKGLSGTNDWELLEGEVDPKTPLAVTTDIKGIGSVFNVQAEGDTDVTQRFKGETYRLVITKNHITSMDPVVSVTMKGSDVTSSVVTQVNKTTTEIYISNVKGPIEIEYLPCNNAIYSAMNVDGSSLYGADCTPGNGYLNGCYCSSVDYGGDYAGTDSSCVALGLMKLPSWNNADKIDVYIYSKGANIDPTTSHVRAYLYKGYDGKGGTEVKPLSKFDSQYTLFDTDGDGTKDYLKFSISAAEYSAYQYMRLSVQGTGENLIVTFNEPILPEVKLTGGNATLSTGDIVMRGGYPYSGKVSALPGYNLLGVSVKMGGEDISNTYNSETGEINIPNVTGNVTITATTEEISFAAGTKFDVKLSTNSDPIFSGSNQVDAKAPYTATITAKSGNLQGNVYVYMDGQLVSYGGLNESSYVIDIPAVYGNVEICYHALTNIVPTSTYKGEAFGTNGYKDGYCLSSDLGSYFAGAKVSAGHVATAWMKLPDWTDAEGNTRDTIEIYVYIANGKLNSGTSGSLRNYFSTDGANQNTSISTTYMEYVNTSSYGYMKITLNYNDHNNLKYYRVSVQGLGENLIVTCDEPIFPDSVFDGE